MWLKFKMKYTNMYISLLLISITLFIKTVFKYFQYFALLFSVICIELYCFPGPSFAAAQYPDQASPPWSP